ncbi:hypothetical protein MHYP_G00156970 [Metynnis hypsauchen]
MDRLRSTTKREVRCLLRLAGCYHRFLVRLLTNLAKSGQIRMDQDVLDRGPGAILSQVVDEEDCLWHKLFVLGGGRWGSIKCLAIKWAVLTLCYDLFGCSFTLCSDHTPVAPLHERCLDNLLVSGLVPL